MRKLFPKRVEIPQNNENKMDTNPLLLTDFYKVGHPFQYPEGTQYVYSNLTPRKSRIEGIDKVVFFGLQYFIKKYLIEYFNKNFFERSKDQVMTEYKRRVKNALGSDLPSYKHIEDLHDLGFLPITIKALPEGSHVAMRVPVLTIVNTDPRFYWLTNFIESLMSAILWQPITSATISNAYRVLLDKYAKETGDESFVQWQGHDFSFRGMSSLESAVLSGMGHLISFTGTDTIPAIDALEQYYGANSDTELVGGSVPATEHSVMCAGGKDDELGTFRRLIKLYGEGTFSVVSDTWDLWKVLSEILPQLHDEIVGMKGKLVIRPDSGNPADILCGLEYDPGYEMGASEKGVVETLWDIFGGTMNTKGFKVLNSHIGAIYGDSITLEIAEEVCRRLKVKGFASTNVVFGIGSYTYQYNTRDTFGFAMKATNVIINGKSTPIFKDPVTDDGTKKSATGLLKVEWIGNGYALHDNVHYLDEHLGHLAIVFQDGRLTDDYVLHNIRATSQWYRGLK
jgi:nicotinamide phosphoribosyltransferase